MKRNRLSMPDFAVGIQGAQVQDVDSFDLTDAAINISIIRYSTGHVSLTLTGMKSGQSTLAFFGPAAGSVEAIKQMTPAEFQEHLDDVTEDEEEDEALVVDDEASARAAFDAFAAEAQPRYVPPAPQPQPVDTSYEAFVRWAQANPAAFEALYGQALQMQQVARAIAQSPASVYQQPQVDPAEAKKLEMRKRLQDPAEFERLTGIKWQGPR